MIGTLLVGAIASPVDGQDTRIWGRVEDSFTRSPIPGVRLFTSDSATIAVTDSSGAFTLPVPPQGPITILAERYGYRPDRFELPARARSARSVLLLEPTPVELPGISVVEEAAVNELMRNLERRRVGFAGPARGFDKDEIDRLGEAGSVWGFVRRLTFAYVEECFDSRSGLCYRAMARRSARPQIDRLPIMVCIDGRRSWQAVSELEYLDLRDVALIELYDQGRKGIFVFTAPYIRSRADRGRLAVRPLAFRC